MITVEQLAKAFVEIADTLIEDFDLLGFLQVVTRCSAAISNSASAGLLLVNGRGRLQFMAASHESVQLLELFQVQTEQGPCLDCFRSGAPVVATNLAGAADRWPLFAPHAIHEGFRSVHAFPLRHRQDVIGALNLFSTTTGGLEPADMRIIQALADVATVGLLQHHIVRDHLVITDQLQNALNSRIPIEQAKGFLARTHNITVDAAFEMLRDYARRTHRHLTDVARAVVTDPSAHPDLTADR